VEADYSQIELRIAAENEFDHITKDYNKMVNIEHKRSLVDHPRTGDEISQFAIIRPKSNLVNGKANDDFMRNVNHLWMDLNYPGSDKNRHGWKYRSFWLDNDQKTDGIVVGIQMD
jgi:hypothetical protein